MNNDQKAPGGKFAGIGLACGLVALIFGSWVPNVAAAATLATSGNAVIGIILGVVFIIIAIAGIVLGAKGGKANAEAGFPKGALSVVAIVFSILALVACIAGLGCAILCNVAASDSTF